MNSGSVSDHALLGQKQNRPCLTDQLDYWLICDFLLRKEVILPRCFRVFLRKA